MNIPARSKVTLRMQLKPDYLIMAFFLTATMLSACNGPDQVSAIPRTSQFKPVFGEEKINNSKDAKKHAFDVSFLHEDHFACLRINPTSVVNNDDFADVQWADVEDQIAEWIGDRNSKLDLMASVWLVFDQSVVSSMGGESTNGESGQPMTWIVEYERPFDADELAKANASRTDSNWVVEALSVTQLSIGSRSSVDKLSAQGGSTGELSDLIVSWDKQTAVQGALTIAPVRSFLVSIFEIVARFGPEAQKFASLPDVVKHVHLQIDLENTDGGEASFLQGNISIDDKELAKEIVKSLSNLGGNGSSPLPSILNGGMGGPGQSATMFTPSAVGAMSKLVTEIKDENLFSLQDQPGQIVFSLVRPKSLRDAVAASVADGKKQLSIIGRTEQLNRIANALNSYVEAHGRLPSYEPISFEASADAGVPAQFSWRTAILPYLNQEELYERFDFSKPWDAPENLEVSKDIPKEFKLDDASLLSALHLAAGVDAVYRPDRPQPVAGDIKDKKIWTAIVIETNASLAKNWIQPGFVALDDASTEDLGQDDENGILLINAAFKTRAIKKENELIRKVITSDGGEKLTRQDFIQLQMSAR